MGGYCGRVLRINLSERSSSQLKIEESLLKEFVGGAGLAAKLHYDLGSFEYEPLSAENPLILMTGPLNATKIPGTSRIEFCARSPHTRIWGESNSGGKMGAYLKFAGWDGIIIEGASKVPVYIFVDVNGAEIRDASELWGKGCYESQELIKKDIGEKRISTAVIGPAGENLVKYACVQLDNSRHAGRTGIGAVMGSKKLKGIAVVYDPGERFKIKYSDPRSLDELVADFVTRIKNDFSCSILRDLGTAGYMETGESFGDVPTKYYTLGSFDGAAKISGSAMATSILRRRDGCLGCIVRCGRVVKFGGKEIHGPEYETLASFGALQLNDDLESIIEINYTLNDLGLDSISAGVSIAFTMWMSERGIGEFNIGWGETEKVKELVEDIAYRRGIGNELAEGVRYLGKKYGVEDWAAHVKGLEIPMHDPRAFSALACAYATHPRGACHLPHQMYLYEMGKKIKEYGVASKDRFSNKGKGVMTAKVQNFTEIFNAAILCAFMPVNPTVFAKMLKYVTGYDYDSKKLFKVGERIFTIKRLYNLKCGVTASDDKLPKIVLRPVKGGSEENVPDIKKQVQEYYKYRRWREGAPTEEKLDELNLK